eukprot:COSAG01_NODE_44529_length_418_cov_0.818182_1_plen_82_part_10
MFLTHRCHTISEDSSSVFSVLRPISSYTSTFLQSPSRSSIVFSSPIPDGNSRQEVGGGGGALSGESPSSSLPLCFLEATETK